MNISSNLFRRSYLNLVFLGITILVITGFGLKETIFVSKVHSVTSPVFQANSNKIAPSPDAPVSTPTTAVPAQTPQLSPKVSSPIVTTQRATIVQSQDIPKIDYVALCYKEKELESQSQTANDSLWFSQVKTVLQSINGYRSGNSTIEMINTYITNSNTINADAYSKSRTNLAYYDQYGCTDNLTNTPSLPQFYGGSEVWAPPTYPN